MRENMGLYRGKREDNGEWVEGFYVRLHDSKGHESHRIYSGYAETDCGDYYPDWHEVIPETIGECSGLPDKNGELIFEGDIIRVGRSYMFDDDDCKTEIGVGIVTLGIGTFDMGFYRYLGWHCKKSDGDVDSYPIVDCDEDWISEVIGNIHDNPELSEVSGDD